MSITFSNPSRPFGQILRRVIDDHVWTQIDIAVAYCRISGLRLVNDTLVRFIQRGGALNIVVGIDSNNGGTSREAIERLLHYKSIAPERVQVVICHFATETGSPRHAFHPKIYAFSNENHGRAYIGSHNLTRGGLQNNIEVAVENSGPLEGNRVISDAIGIVRELIENGTRCRSLVDHDDFERLLRTNHPRMGNYGRLIGCEFEEHSGGGDGGGNQQGEPDPGEYEDPLSGRSTAGITTFIQPDDSFHPWAEDESPEAQQEPEEVHPDVRELVVWSTRLQEHMLQRNNEDSHMMGGVLQLPLVGSGEYALPEDEWANDRGQQFFRNQLVPAELWVVPEDGDARRSIFSEQCATCNFAIHFLDDEVEYRDLVFSWSGDRGAKGGQQNITLELPLDLLNQPGQEPYRAVAGFRSEGMTNVGHFLTIVRSGHSFHLFVSDPPPTQDQLQAL